VDKFNNIQILIQEELQKNLKTIPTELPVDKFTSIANYPGKINLDATEEKILKLHSIEGKSYKNIAESIHLSETNIKKKANDIKNKLGANNMPQATFLYFFHKEKKGN
jgi:DNA-binding NarL/FixJ family response regulator